MSHRRMNIDPTKVGRGDDRNPEITLSEQLKSIFRIKLNANYAEGLNKLKYFFHKLDKKNQTGKKRWREK